MLSIALVLLCLILVLLFRHFQLIREIKKIIKITRGIQTGNLNLRYRLQISQRDIENLGGELNRLVDYFQNGFERITFLEEERKRMIANISHDLRTPLTSLLGYTEALKFDTSLTTEEREDFLRITSEKGNALLVLLQDFFELAKLEADDFELKLQKINLVEIVPEILLSFYPDFVKAEITPIIKLPETPLYAQVDEVCLRRVLNNLLSNALCYGIDGKEIGIALREEESLVWVDVWDRGKGIPAQDIPHIFDRLYTGEASRNSSLQGTGLGLTITKNLVEKQGGRIIVTSAPNEMTVFSFCLTKG
ncbi:His Kinase A (phospho-acceptor) domain-containing protein [Seinonella peptonophila]|uniref:histidine kinase n=1 Tax=Seinonella peptonophila TaxID=112248 RepID=A0A1M4SSG6_9BACL|nr:sensor histidine kinase [Seinonella peptonophila]SHE35194.1 His Kinase A (phospho-acceptor) domain-containing protein [Seinonella peptonophila]